MTDGQAPYLYFKGAVMAEKDMTEKTLESYNEVFADIVNVSKIDFPVNF